MIGFALAALLAPQVELPARVGVSASYQPTIASVTEPLRQVDCRLAGNDRQWSPLSLRFTGGLGYRTEDGQVRATPRAIEVLSDPAGLLEELPLWQADGETLLFGSEKGRSVVLWSASPPPAFGTVALIPRGPGMTRAAGDPAYAGFCNVTEVSQLPESEAAEAGEERPAYHGMVSMDRMRTAVLTPAELTKPEMQLECAVADREGAWHRVTLNVSGGRGYGEPWAGGVINTHTPQRGEVVEDASRLFGGLPPLEDKYDTLVFGNPDGPFVEFRSFGGPPQFSLVTVTQRRHRYERSFDEQSFAGHCEVNQTAQPPLSEEETIAWLDR